MEIETDIEKTSYDKGRELEVEFAEFMRSDLGWQKTRVGAHLPGKLNRKGAAIDVIAYKRDVRGNKLYNLGLIVSLIGAGSIIISIVLIFLDDTSGIISMAVGFVASLFGVYIINDSNKYQKENALVECKNLKGKVTINQIEKSLREIKDYRLTGDKEHKFEYHYFVSTSGFMENALIYAEKNDIICYEKKDGKFINTKYWDETKNK